MKKVLIVHAIDLERFDLHFDGVETRQILTGIGKTNAAMNMMREALDYQPDFVLNVGSAGTLNHSVGDILVSRHFVDRDLDRMRLFGLEYNVVTEVPASVQLKSLVSGREVEQDFVVNTGDDFVTACDTLTGDAVDMEAFAEARVCNQLHLPMLSVKYITDVIGQNSVLAWEEKLADAREGLAAFFYRNVSLFYKMTTFVANLK